jgi:uncharacterized membrane protein
VTFGNFQLASIGGAKFQDTNGNGVRDPGEPGLQGFTIFIDANNNGILDAGETSTTTDANGNYSFANLSPGTYTIREVQQSGFTQTTANPAAITPTSGQTITAVTFGNFQLTSIGGAKFQDTNGNGVRNPGEPGLRGFTIFIDANNNGILDVGETSTTTDVNGNYSFANLGPGTYRIREVQQSGFTQTTANPAAITATSGQAVTAVNFGNFRLISISGNKFQDTNGNRVRNSGEPGLRGFTIYIDANNNHVLDPGERSTTTDANGNYSFANLGPGTYRVREVAKSGFVQMTNDPANIVATSGANVTGVAFGNMPVANLAAVSKLLFTGRNLTNLLNGTFSNQANFVANLYETSLGRAPTVGELTYYLRLLRAGYTQQQVAAMFRASFRL